MFGYNSPFFDFLRLRDREATYDPNAMTPAFGSPDTSFAPQMWASGSPAGDDGGIMGGGDSLAAGAGGLSKDQISGGLAAAKGIGAAINAFSGGDQKPIQAPRIDDNSAQIRQQAAQMWQQMMQKKPRGLI